MSLLSHVGIVVDEVVLNIDYKIIEHFSQHLYSSPNKAVEELVINGFDAFAEKVEVFLTGRYTTDSVLVWDNGSSMSIDGLKGLWHIADSPKQGRRTVSKNGVTRNIIGKFGIGKIASYTLGDEITHLCRIQNEFLEVSVDYRIVQQDLLTGSEPAKDNGKHNLYKTPIRRLTEVEARKQFESLFHEKPNSFDEMFSAPNWTLAIITALKGDRLTPVRLRWVLGNGMPLRPDFGVWVDREKVESKVADGICIKWDFGHPDLHKEIIKEWTEKNLALSTLPIFKEETGIDPSRPEQVVPYVELPDLGKVWGEVRLYEDTLKRDNDYGRSYGFFVFVQGRLVNSDDEKLRLIDPSFGTFYRSRYLLYVDALDEDLLANRTQFKADTSRMKQLAKLQRAVYQLTRHTRDSEEQQKEDNRSYAQRLPVYSRAYYVEPMMALVKDNEASLGELPGFPLNAPRVKRQPLDPEGSLCKLDEEGFVVNSNHPFVAMMSARFGEGKRGQEVQHEVEYIAVSEALFHGFLLDSGLTHSHIEEIMAWRDAMFRRLAESSHTEPELAASNLISASYRGHEEFEFCIVKVLELMGFDAERDGRKGMKDVKMTAPAGDNTYFLTFEAKGSGNSIPNDSAEVASADSHRDAAGAEHAVIVARKFVGFDGTGSEETAILRECRTSGRVSIMEVEAVVKMLKVMHRYAYPLDAVKEVFTAIESPRKKLERIEALEDPFEDFDFSTLLRRIWTEQLQYGVGESVPYKTIWQRSYRSQMEFKSFGLKLLALQVMASSLISLIDNNEVYLRQHPDRIIARIQANLDKLPISTTN